MTIKTIQQANSVIHIEYDGFVSIDDLTEGNRQAQNLIPTQTSYRLVVDFRNAAMLPMNPRVMKEVSPIFTSANLQNATFVVNQTDRVLVNMLNAMLNLLDRGKFELAEDLA